MCVFVATAGQLGHVVKGIEHQQGVLQFTCCLCCQFGIRQHGHQCFDIVTTVHIPKQGDGHTPVDQGAISLTPNNGG